MKAKTHLLSAAASVVRLSLYAAPISLVALFGTMGCQTNPTVAIEGAEIVEEPNDPGFTLADEPADPTDPYTCVHDEERDFPFTCSVSGEECFGWGLATHPSLCEEPGCETVMRYHVRCGAYCQSADDCPQPNSGDITAVCNKWHSCELACNPGDECPDGLVCASTEDFATEANGERIHPPYMCMQPFELPNEWQDEQ